MNAKQESKLNMYRATQTHCDNNPAIVGTVLAFATALAGFKANVSAIIATAQQEDQVTKGITTDKKVSKKTLAQLAADVAAPIFAYAASINDNTLKEQVNFSFSEIYKAKDEVLPVRCQNIHDAGNTNLASLAPFGITGAILKSLQNAIDGYQLKVPTPRNAAADKKTINQNLINLFKATDLILKEQMDKTLVGLKAAFPDFVASYKTNRIIIDPGKTTTELTGTITNSANDAPVELVNVVIVETNVTAVTDAQGVYSFKPVVPGTYTVTISKKSFNDVQQSGVKVKLGQVNKLNVPITASVIK